MLEIRLPYRPANLFEDAVMAQCPTNHGEPPSVAAILAPARRQVNAQGSKAAPKTFVFDGQETASVGFLYEPAPPA